ncbi:hypothetical protein GCM10022206_60860 [Streptomyces chiangmaiensis]
MQQEVEDEEVDRDTAAADDPELGHLDYEPPDPGERRDGGGDDGLGNRASDLGSLLGEVHSHRYGSSTLVRRSGQTLAQMSRLAGKGKFNAGIPQVDGKKAGPGRRIGG